jgi:hypothetical protein
MSRFEEAIEGGDPHRSGAQGESPFVEAEIGGHHQGAPAMTAVDELVEHGGEVLVVAAGVAGDVVENEQVGLADLVEHFVQ